LIECATSWKNIEHGKFLCGEVHFDHSFLAPTACCILGMTSAVERASILGCRGPPSDVAPVEQLAEQKMYEKLSA
jgi:hypothetical protein